MVPGCVLLLVKLQEGGVVCNSVIKYKPEENGDTRTHESGVLL